MRNYLYHEAACSATARNLRPIFGKVIAPSASGVLQFGALYPRFLETQMNMIITLLLIFACIPAISCRAELFGVARTAAPVLNVSEFSNIFGNKNSDSLKTDRCGQVRELEYIALPGAVFEITGELKSGTHTIYRVKTNEYQAAPGITLYVDSRFLAPHTSAPPPRKTMLPSREHLLKALTESVGSPYVWGGNVRDGVPELLDYFYRNADSPSRRQMTLAGLDCSGLLYFATAGWTPRNTSELIFFGRPVTIGGKDAAAIAGLLEPLDLIVWNGHVLIVLDRQTAIESRLECGKPGNGGVVITPLKSRLSEIMRTRKPVNEWPVDGKKSNVFVVRRWYGLQLWKDQRR